MIKSKKMNVVGIMSGTSLDGVDFVLTSLGGEKPIYKDMSSVSFPKKLKSKLFEVAEGKMDFRESQLVHFELGAFYNKALSKIVDKKGWRFSLIGLHGQTVFHQAPEATTQIGEPSFLKSFDVPVVSDFRSKIVTAGGQGAPLAPIFHRELLKSGLKGSNWGFLNIGGMTNITIKIGDKTVATDLGPGNVFLDQAAREFLNKDFDKNGNFAQKGLPDLKVVKRFVAQTPFFSKRFPKSCGRKDFSETAFRNLLRQMTKLSQEDQMATLAELSLFPIVSFLKNKGVTELIVAGGGVKNAHLMNELKRRLVGVDIQYSEDFGWPGQAVEGGAFAHLAFMKIKGKSPDLGYMGLKKTLSPLGRVD